MLIDTHCHLDFDQFDSDRELVIKRALGNKVEYIINVNSDISSAKKVKDLAQEYPSIFFTIGHHPHYAEKFRKNIIDEIKPLFEHPKLVAIGEVGLDYYRNLSKKESQIKVFNEFIGLSKQLSLPLITHCRESENDIFDILNKEFKDFRNIVFHCFSGTRDFLEKCLSRDAMFSFTGNITYPKAVNLRSIIKMMPLEKIMLETDAPYLAPQKMRGKRNEPSYVHFVAQEISAIKGISFEEVAKQTSLNARIFFKLKTTEKI